MYCTAFDQDQHYFAIKTCSKKMMSVFIKVFLVFKQIKLDKFYFERKNIH